MHEFEQHHLAAKLAQQQLLPVREAARNSGALRGISWADNERSANAGAIPIANKRRFKGTSEQF